MKTKQLLLGIFILVFILIGCQSANEGTTNESYPVEEAPVVVDEVVEEEVATEAIVSDDKPDGYPGNEDLFYPNPNAENIDPELGYPVPVYDESKRFTIDEPLTPGMTTLSGTGPAGTSIRLVSISNVGEPLAFGVIDENGQFEFTISRELDTQEAIGIMLGDESQKSQFLDAPGGTDIPMLGFVLDVAAVTQE